MSVRQLGVGIIGAGRIAQVHAGNLAQIEEARLIAVADVNEKAAKRMSKTYRMEAYTDYTRLLERDDIDLVMICTPTHVHADVAINSAKAGKHIFCEKPIATTLKDADDMISATRRADVKLTVGFMLRFTPPHPRIKEIMNKGMIGDVIAARAEAYGWAPPPGTWIYEPDKGMGVLDVAVHHVDLFRWLVGEVDKVYADGGAFVVEDSKRYGTADNAIILLKFKSGTLGDIFCSFSTGYGNILMEIYGVKGSVYLNYLDKQSITLFLKERYGENSAIIPAGWSYPDVLWTYGYKGEMKHFIKCILEDKEPLVSGEDGRASLEILLAAMKSMRTGKFVGIPLK